MNLSNHFKLSEAIASDTAERLSINNMPSQTVIETMVKAAAQLEEVRSLLGTPLIITSWYRCKLLNRAIGSSDTSAHIQGFAIDFKAPEYGTPIEICKAMALSKIKFDQVIQEGSWVHISFDPRHRQQILTAVFQQGKKTQYKVGI